MVQAVESAQSFFYIFAQIVKNYVMERAVADHCKACKTKGCKLLKVVAMCCNALRNVEGAEEDNCLIL